ncbi:hypothetical protein QZH41_006995, partial [Actinostola sp. cb2023]
AERSADWSLHLAATTAMVPYFYAHDRPNYSRWLPVYLADMAQLEQKHPEVYRQFMEGEHACRSSQKEGNKLSGKYGIYDVCVPYLSSFLELDCVLVHVLLATAGVLVFKDLAGLCWYTEDCWNYLNGAHFESNNEFDDKLVDEWDEIFQDNELFDMIVNNISLSQLDGSISMLEESLDNSTESLDDEIPPDAKESPQQFLMRALDMRNKVIFVSQEADCDFNYGLKLIQNTFLKSFETGLRDDILATNLRPMLRTQNLTDEELMKSVNEMASHQIECRNKLATERQKTARVNVCVSEGVQKNVGHPKKTDASSDDVSRKLLAEIKQMQSELSNLKVQVDATNVSNTQGYSEQTRPFRGRGRGRGRPYNQQRRAWGCSYCKERGTAESCRHVSPAVAIITSLTTAQKRHKTRETMVGYPPGTESSRVKTNVPFL